MLGGCHQGTSVVPGPPHRSSYILLLCVFLLAGLIVGFRNSRVGTERVLLPVELKCM